MHTDTTAEEEKEEEEEEEEEEKEERKQTRKRRSEEENGGRRRVTRQSRKNIDKTHFHFVQILTTSFAHIHLLTESSSVSPTHQLPSQCMQLFQSNCNNKHLTRIRLINVDELMAPLRPFLNISNTANVNISKRRIHNSGQDDKRNDPRQSQPVRRRRSG